MATQNQIAMKEPFAGKGLRKCCFCFVLDPDFTCYLIGALCIGVIAFGGMVSMGFGDWITATLTLFGFAYYFSAGSILILGTLYMNRRAKLLYCWMSLLGLLLVILIIAVVCTSAIRDDLPVLKWCEPRDYKCKVSVYCAIILQYVFLIFWSIYTPLVVLGNMDTYRMVYDGIAIIIISSFVHEERNYFFGNATHLSTTTLIEPDTISPTTMIFNILLLFGCCCGLISSILLIYGLIKNERIFLIPWIMTVFVKSIVDVSHTLYLVMLAAKRLNPIHIVLFTLDFFLLVLTIYAFLCVISQYQEYKAGRGRAEDDPLRHPVPYQPPPTATSCLSTRKPGTYHETTATEQHSTLVTNDYSVSPCHHNRKTSTKHVQFGISEDGKHRHDKRRPERSEQEVTSTCGRTLDVLMEETSWIQPQLTLSRTEPDKKLLLEADSDPTAKDGLFDSFLPTGM